MTKTKPKDIGTKFESACVKIFNEAGFVARRLALSGSNDQGDVEVKMKGDGPCVIVVECKAYKSWSRGMLAKWREQAVTEALNYSKAHNVIAMPCLIVSQYGKSNNDSYVHIQDTDGWIQMYLDEFIGGQEFPYAR